MITAQGVLEGSLPSILAMLFIRGDGPSVGTSRGELIRGNGADGFIIVPPCGRRDEGERKLDSLLGRFHVRATTGEADWLTTKSFL